MKDGSLAKVVFCCKLHAVCGKNVIAKTVFLCYIQQRMIYFQILKEQKSS